MMVLLTLISVDLAKLPSENAAHRERSVEQPRWKPAIALVDVAMLIGSHTRLWRWRNSAAIFTTILCFIPLVVHFGY
jgi:hypothetical protein